MLKNALLDHYHCTFFLPLVGLPAGVKPTVASNKCARVKHTPGEAIDHKSYESFLYFTPSRRSILFDQIENDSVLHRDALIPMKEWLIDESVYKNWRVELGMPEVPQQDYHQDHLQQVAAFTSIKLFQFFNGIYLLAYTLKPEALLELERLPKASVALFNENQDEAPRFLNELPHDTDEQVKQLCQKLQLEAWLRFSRLARQLYPTFEEQISESKIARLIIRDQDHAVVAENPTRYKSAEDKQVRLPKNANELLAPTVVHIASLFFGKTFKDNLHHLQVNDDRMFISVAYGLAGRRYEESALHCIKSLVAFTDRFEDIIEPFDDFGLGYPYDIKGTSEELKSSELGLWGHLGAHYIYNDMVNAYLSSGSFFRSVIASKHIPHIYDRMLAQALLYQASLRHYDHQLTLLTRQALDDGTQNEPALKNNQREFIQFTNQYWFKELTNQMQGKKIFALQQRGLQLQPYYQQIESELKQTHEYRLAVNSEITADLSNRLAWVGILFALVALIPTYFDFWLHDEIPCWLKLWVTAGTTIVFGVLAIMLLKRK